MSRFVFATNYNEGEDFLALYIENFLHYTDESCSLIINLAPGRRLADPALRSAGRVHIFNGETHRSKWGMGIALGHLESYAYAARHLGSFDYFCTLASNALFFRALDKQAILNRLAAGGIFPEAHGRDYRADHDIPVTGFERDEGSWAWVGFNQSASFRRCLADICRIERCTVTQIEGFVASREDWDIILAFEPQIRLLQAALAMDPDDPRNYMAVEEMLFSTFVMQHGSGRFTHLCFMFWDGLGRVGPKELLSTLPALPPYLCSAKWFERSITDPGAILVGTEAGRALLDACRGGPAIRSTMLAQLRHGLDGLEAAPLEETSIAMHWGDLPGWMGSASIRRTLYLARQYEQLLAGPGDPLATHAPFFLAEMAHVPFELSLELAGAENELSVVATGSFPLQRQSTALAGYVYLSCRRPVSEFILAFDTREGAERVKDRIVVYDNAHDYQLMSPIRISGSEGNVRLHYQMRNEAKHRIMSIGLPCYGRLFTATRMTVLETPVQAELSEAPALVA
ncbi:hypothetical protein [Asaia krungthepensis]|nr:hypothetical protein [Asaia krungthepensis]